MIAVSIAACEHSPAPGHAHADPLHSASRRLEDDNAKLEAVATIHGGAGPWAVAGYRMGEAALKQLGLERGSFDLEVAHFAPREVQYSCIADGAAAATGASIGKLNLTLAEAAAKDLRTSYRRRSTGQVIVFRLTDAFKTRFLDVPRERLGAAGREVLRLKDAEIFETAR
ncbi:MAG TPA: FmdE family protein [Polyangiaceae bacterium]|nr:FmdE family protein [Polyangiaceae bacterium]